MRNRSGKTAWYLMPVSVFLLGSGMILAGQLSEQDGLEAEPGLGESSVSAENCNFLSDARSYLENKEYRFLTRSRTQDEAVRGISRESGTKNLTAAVVHADELTRKTFIDEEIFWKMAVDNVPSAPLASDTEFLRRVYLDLTGRIPSAWEVDYFSNDTNPTKRDVLVDRLVNSPEFVDKWTMFFGDLFENNINSTQYNRFVQGRDAYYLYLRESIRQNKPYDHMAREMITATGSNFDNGAANWPQGATIAMGPPQDTYDGAAVDLSNMFMGMNVVDCLLCHDGPRHLDEVNLWCYQQTRRNQRGLSAYFARMRLQRTPVPELTNVQYTMVFDATAGNYNLNTTIGNRTARQLQGVNFITPRYPFSGDPEAGSGIQNGENYRQALARQLTADPQFARAAVNYIWEELMVEAFVSPSNGFDLARLDPSNPPPAPWTLQPTNPWLLDRLARWFQDSGYNIRELVSLIVKSNAYQLSSTYDGEWKPEYVPYYARKYVRRLDAEEILDAIARSTNVFQLYQLGDTLPPVEWAMQLPDTREPTRTGAVAAFLNVFGRGDRDLNKRRSDGSVLQGLTMLNNTVVTTRIRRATPNSRVAEIMRDTSDPATAINSMMLHTLSRPATEEDFATFLPMYQTMSFQAATENLQWILLNRLQFLFNY